MQIIEDLNFIDENFSESQIIDFVEDTTIAGDYDIEQFLKKTRLY